MKTLLLSLCLTSCITHNSFSQITFQKTFGGTVHDMGYSVQQTTDGGYIIAGRAHSFGAGGEDVYLIKTDANGDSLWTKSFGGTSYDEGKSVQQTTDGGYIITGYTISFGADSADVYLIKTDVNGNSLWTKTFGGTGDDDGKFVQQASDSGYIIAGWTYSFGTGSYDVYLIKTDVNGDSLWTKTFGGTDDDRGNSVQQTSDGGYIISGVTYSFGAGGADVYLIKTDANGDSIWTKTYGGTGNDAATSVQQTSDGGYIITGNTSSFGTGNYEVYLIKTDSIGNSLWTKTFAGTVINEGNSVQQTADGGYIIAGFTSASTTGVDYDGYLIKTDANGNSLWTKTFGSGTYYDNCYSVQQTMDGGYIITGLTYSFGVGNYNIYLIKTDSLGNSGCNEGSTATFVTSPPTQVSSPATIVTSPPTIVTTPATLVGSGGTVTTLCTTVGVPAPLSFGEGLGVRCSPNPSDGNFAITFSQLINKGQIEIYNILGKKVYTEKINNRASCIVNCELNSGIYFVKVFDGEKYYCNKIIIEHD